MDPNKTSNYVQGYKLSQSVYLKISHQYKDFHYVLILEASVQFKCLWYLDNPVGFRCKFVKIFVDRRIVSKYFIKVRSKVNQDSQTVLKSWTELLLNRLKSMKFLYECTLNNFICQGVPVYTRNALRYLSAQEITTNYNTTISGNFPARMLICSATIPLSWIKVHI